jgi:hypothetical protein
MSLNTFVLRRSPQCIEGGWGGGVFGNENVRRMSNCVQYRPRNVRVFLVGKVTVRVLLTQNLSVLYIVIVGVLLVGIGVCCLDQAIGVLQSTAQSVIYCCISCLCHQRLIYCSWTETFRSYVHFLLTVRLDMLCYAMLTVRHLDMLCYVMLTVRHLDMLCYVLLTVRHLDMLCYVMLTVRYLDMLCYVLLTV